MGNKRARNQDFDNMDFRMTKSKTVSCYEFLFMFDFLQNRRIFVRNLENCLISFYGKFVILS